MQIIYCPTLMYPNPAAFLAPLGLEQEPYLLAEEALQKGFSETKRVLLISLRPGTAEVKKLIEQNPQVAEFMLYAPDASTEILRDARNQILRHGGFAAFNEEDALLKALKSEMLDCSKFVIAYASKPPELLSQLELLLKKLLPRTYQISSIQELSKTDASVILLIVEYGEILTLLQGELPLNRTVKIILLPKKGNPSLGSYLLHHRDEQMRALWVSLPGLGWDIGKISENTFFIDPENELRRLAIAERPSLLKTLRNEASFVMWDDLGLPMLVRDYTPAAIEKFLSGFDGAARLAASLKKGY